MNILHIIIRKKILFLHVSKIQGKKSYKSIKIKYNTCLIIKDNTYLIIKDNRYLIIKDNT